MAYDEGLADRVRPLYAGLDGVRERKMFGGVGFEIAGNIATGVRGDDLLVRVDVDAGDELAAEHPSLRRLEMRGREMRGWLLVGPELVATDADLERWVRRGQEFARSLDPK